MRSAVASAVVATCLLAACGGSTTHTTTSATAAAPSTPKPRAGAPRKATLMLDFTPNAAHAGIYSAVARGYDLQAGIRLRVIPPPSPADSIKLLQAGKVDFSVLDIHDLAIADERGGGTVGIAAIVERPLAALIAQPKFATPRRLEGATIGVAGDPSDLAVVHSILAGSGGRPMTVKTIDIGSGAVPDLLSGRLAAATGFWNDEGVALAQRRPGFHVFRVDSYGAPSYPELVLCATRETLSRAPDLARDVLRALVRGYEFTLAHPSASATDLERLVPGLDPNLIAADLAALRPAFAGPHGQPGELDDAVLESWARWEARFGIVSSAPDVAKTFDTRFTR
jgi:NitT/TauT family transport system substrate-binding protein/putative hydroxymethylpyrimidine transport system substrate-binding protein